MGTCLNGSLAWSDPPGYQCTQCCCCVVTYLGTRNFCPYNSNTIPNCYYLQSHLKEVLAAWSGSGPVLDSYTFPNSLYLAWWVTDPAYGCIKDLATVTPTNVIDAATLPTYNGGTAFASPSPKSGNSGGGCIFQGGNQSNIICNNNSNTNVHGIAGRVTVNHNLLFACIVIAASLLLVSGNPDSAGGCIYINATQENVNCNGNTNNANPSKPSRADTINVNLRWIVIIYVLISISFVMADDSAGGCIIHGGTQINSSCNNNTNNSNAQITTGGSDHSLSSGELAGIVIGSITALITLLTTGAVILNPHVMVDKKPLWHYHRALAYKLAEGSTLGFGCGCCLWLERAVRRFVKAGGLWSWARTAPPIAGQNVPIPSLWA